MRKIPELTGVERAFGCIKHLPPMAEIPDKFKTVDDTPQNEFIGKWFFKGLREEDVAELIPKAGVDKKKALIAISAILRSFEPQHEHKEAGCAYLLDEWFEFK